MEEAVRVLDRLQRIQVLDRHGASAGALLDELRGLVRDAEAWARAEGDERSRTAALKLREEVEGMR
jgi:hypothetical protein